MNIHWIKNEYDTLTTRPNRDAQYYLLRHLRRRGLLNVDGGGRLARFGRISRLKRVCPRTVIEGRLDRIFMAEYEHYVWRVRPHCVYCGVLLTRSTLTRDHVVPRAHGGGGGENLVPSCGPCNRAKGCRSLLQFLVVHRALRARHACSLGGPSAPVESTRLAPARPVALLPVADAPTPRSVAARAAPSRSVGRRFAPPSCCEDSETDVRARRLVS